MQQFRIIDDFRIDWDEKVMVALNDWGGEFWDILFLGLSHKFYALPLYLFMLYLLYKHLGWKKLIVALVAVALCITVSDQLANLFKKTLVLRPRPCHNEALDGVLSLVKDRCGGRYGFYSGHASNSMAVAVLVGLLLRKHVPKFIFILLLWAAAVAYSRVYIGVHYPLDILVGMTMGGLVGFAFAKAYNKAIHNLNL